MCGFVVVGGDEGKSFSPLTKAASSLTPTTPPKSLKTSTRRRRPTGRGCSRSVCDDPDLETVCLLEAAPVAVPCTRCVADDDADDTCGADVDDDDDDDDDDIDDSAEETKYNDLQ